MMLKNSSRAQVVGAWFAAIIVMFACAVVSGANITVSTGELWLAACVVPPAVMLLVWRGGPALTVAELLHAVDGSSKGGRQ
jgi:hypothetical protein